MWIFFYYFCWNSDYTSDSYEWSSKSFLFIAVQYSSDEDIRPRQKRKLNDSLDQVMANYNLVYKLRILSFLAQA